VNHETPRQTEDMCQSRGMAPTIYLEMRKIEDNHWWFRALRALVLQEACSVLPGRPRVRVLDVGCGTGGTIAALHEVDPAHSLFAVDVSPQALAFTRDRRAGAVIGASADQLPFRDSSFDLVISLDVLSERGVAEERSMAELARLLKPGGRLLLNLPAFHWLRGAHDLAVDTVRRYTRRSAHHLVGRAGLDVHSMSYWNTTLLPLMAVWRPLSRLLLGRQLRSDLRSIPSALNACLARLVRTELQLRRRTGLPWGSSLFVVATKRGPEGPVRNAG
jgi:SAM-dependent methyltransferase